ncbi:MAG: MBL fold metallo-hydrolase [Pseudomonadales bacterium]|nr:MBL fold metallo-hydrolase [Pseudomonadales bacterium]
MKKIKYGLIAIAATMVLVFGINGCVSAPVYQGPKSDHFNGRVFVNTIPSDKTPWDIFKLGFFSLFEQAPWPEWIESTQSPVPHERVYGDKVSVTFINHSTVLVQLDGVNILADPVFSDRVSPFNFAGPKRVRKPGVALEDLPPIDLIIISHNHYDHLDIQTLKNIVARQPQDQAPLIVAGLGNGGYFELEKMPNYKDLDWNQSVTLKGIEVIFTEARHRSGRGISDQMRTLWGSFLLKTSHGEIYFAGDTGYGPHFKDLSKQFGDIELAFLPIGAYQPRWFMEAVHLNPKQAVLAHQDIASQQTIGIHYGTFQLTYESIDQPKIDLSAALEAHSVDPKEFITLGFGETREFDLKRKL